MKSIALVVTLIATLIFGTTALAQEGTSSLAGTQWQLVSIDNTNALLGTTVTLEFGEDNVVFGSAGCNSYTTTISKRSTN
ncbi:META domain-containing protein, partial [bacterium]|nr:META domain-containing protein [bacterium]